jgi:hypothetical protein
LEAFEPIAELRSGYINEYMLRKKITRRNSTRRRPPQPKKNSRLLEMAIVIILALVIIYGASFAIRITHGLSRTVDSPDYVIRLQILNGCGVDGAAARVSAKLARVVRLPIEVNVVDVGDFNSYHVGSSFIISRVKDLTPARILAEQIGCETESIIFEPIENNYRSITMTLVLGEDFEKIFHEPLE